MTAAIDGARVGNGRRVRLSGRHEERKTFAAVRPEYPVRQAGTPWRFVLIVEPAPEVPPEARRPSVPTPLAVRLMGPGATLLEEPFDPMVRIRFDWPASTQTGAIAAAVRAVESCELRVLRVDNEDLVTTADVAHRVGMSRETARLWAVGQMGPGGFPPPVNPRRETTFYAWSEVLPWLRERKDMDLPEEEPALVAANLAIRLRALLPRLARPELILDLLRRPGTKAPGQSASPYPGDV